eukprot:1575876-Rhodomonas_salina.1
MHTLPICFAHASCLATRTLPVLYAHAVHTLVLTRALLLPGGGLLNTHQSTYVPAPPYKAYNAYNVYNGTRYAPTDFRY